MSYLVLARKCRPQKFDEVVGQDHVTRTLCNAINMDRVAHGFLFSGVRGVGKTSMARILAKSLNCSLGPTVDPCGECASCRAVTAGTAMDVIEIDGASNNSVDDIRDLRETVPYRPALGRFKIYVIDEVHMLSASAFNALLKTLEEPPPHVKFIFATTEPHKIPATILSRCQHYGFRRIPTEAIVGRMEQVLKSEGIRAQDGALTIIGREAEGSMRDALSILDQVLAVGAKEITIQAVGDLLGVVSRQVHFDLSAALIAGDPGRCLEIIRDVNRQGFDMSVFSRDLLEHLRNLMTAGICGDDRSLLDMPDTEIDDLVKQARSVSRGTLHRFFKHFSEAYEEIARSSNPRILLEATLARLADLGELVSAAELLSRIEDLAAGRPLPPSPHRGNRSGGKKEVASPPAPKIAQTSDVAPLSEADWKDLLADFGRIMPAKSSIIERGIPAKGSSNDVLTLQFDRKDGFAAQRALETDFKKALTDFLTQRAGHPVRVDIQVRDLGQLSTLAKERLEKQEARRQRHDEAREHPVVREAEITFGGIVSKVHLSDNDKNGTEKTPDREQGE